ncbi:MAG TPA: GNAT family N-acetyltransferase [Gaiellaceae bacterium]
MAQTTIREVGPSDAAFIGELLNQLGYPVSEDELHDRLRRLGADGQQLIVAELDGELAGIALTQIYPVLISAAPTCRLAVIVVAEQARRQGVGRELLLAAEDEARRAGCDRIVLESGTWRDEAHDFYSTLGFESIALGFRKRL